MPHPGFHSLISLIIDRLATLRDRRGSFGPNCRWAFDVLLQRVGATSYWLKPRDMATMLWSIAKVAELEGVGLPVVAMVAWQFLDGHVC